MVVTTTQPAASVSFHRSDPCILRVRDLRTYFPIRRGLFQRVVGHVRAVDDVSFDVYRGRTLGLVGESGCGKTTVARTILRLVDPTSGRVEFNGVDLFALPPRRLRQVRRHLQIVFQDPYSSLNPRMTVGRAIAEPLRVHGIARGSELRDRVAGLLEKVGLAPAYANRYPHEFSGGQRQRVGIARALALQPELLICDEPVSALDVSIQSQILNLLADLRDEFQLSYLFVAHNLAVVEHFCDEVAVMYLGHIVEIGSRDAVYDRPQHPYTVSLLSAAPSPDPTRRMQRLILRGEVPSPARPPTGCPFHPRCPLAVDVARDLADANTTRIEVDQTSVRVPRPCVEQMPELRVLEPAAGSGTAHCAACHFAERLSERSVGQLAEVYTQAAQASAGAGIPA